MSIRSVLYAYTSNNYFLALPLLTTETEIPLGKFFLVNENSGKNCLVPD